MPNAFGFTRPGQQPTPDPRQVGQQLMQMPKQVMSQRAGQQPQQGISQPGMPQTGHMDVDPVDAVFPMHSKESAFRREGGKLMGSGGSDNAAAMSQAVGEALTRAGGGHTSNPNPNKNRDANVQRLQQLGISQLEAELLRETL